MSPHKTSLKLDVHLSLSYQGQPSCSQQDTLVQLPHKASMATGSPLVSWLVPVRNAEHFLHQCLKSIEAPTACTFQLKSLWWQRADVAVIG
eukprot:5654606-Amphidinium_carterae.1